ncbi:MAG: hypothetical protein R3E31_16095 [Chloroflexota bacterium]
MGRHLAEQRLFWSGHSLPFVVGGQVGADAAGRSGFNGRFPAHAPCHLHGHPAANRSRRAWLPWGWIILSLLPAILFCASIM